MTHEPADTIPDTDDVLDRLNPVERDLLGLLGRGHTAKSIATLRSKSEAAVNERFRSARRKTGIGSSREIARLIVARENRHDFIGLAPATAPPPELRRPDAHRRASPQRLRLPMAAAVIIAAAAILAQQTAVPPESRPISTRERSLYQSGTAAPDFEALHGEVIAGRPDAQWSAKTERALLDAYRQHPLFVRGAETLTARCNASLCEVTGVASLSPVQAPVEAARWITLTGAALNLDLEVAHAKTKTDTPQATVLTAYWRRSD